MTDQDGYSQAVALVRLMERVGPRAALLTLAEMGAIHSIWGSDANDTLFFGWVETHPPDPEEAFRG